MLPADNKHRRRYTIQARQAAAAIFTLGAPIASCVSLSFFFFLFFLSCLCLYCRTTEPLCVFRFVGHKSRDNLVHRVYNTNIIIIIIIITMYTL